MTTPIRSSLCLPSSPANPHLKNDALAPKKRDKLEKLIHAFGWENKLLAPHLLALPGYEKFLKFFYDSRLIFAIQGYENSLQDHVSEMREGIKMIAGEPYILKDNAWTKWNEISDQFQMDASIGIVDRENRIWNYIYPYGLTQKDRRNLVERVHQLSPKDLDHLYQVGQKFFAEKPEKCPEMHNCAYLQVFTSGDSAFDRGVFGHVGIRLIDRTGQLYSLGFERPRAEALKSTLFKALSTYNVGVSSLDFKEFARFKSRRVTTIPVNTETFDKVLKKIQGYAASPLRFNMMHQNCVTFAVDTLREAGVAIDAKTSAGSLYFHALCPIFLRKIIKTVGRFFAKCPQWVKTTIKVLVFPITVLTFIPRAFFTLMQNLFNLICGAARAATPMAPGAENELDNSKRLTSFHHLYTHWTDIFKVHKAEAPYKIADWQTDQSSTETFRYKGPQFYVV